MSIFEAERRAFSIKTVHRGGLFLLAASVALLIVSFILWTLAATPVFIGITTSIVELCHGIFTRCLGYAGLLRFAFLWAGGLILLSGLVFAAVRAAVTLFSSARAIRRLPLKKKLVAEKNIILIEDRTISTAFTHGIIRPRIYISRGLMESLEAAELRAVLNHELCHKNNYDPLRFFLLSILKDIFYFVPLAAYVYGFLGERQEKRADDWAVASMGGPLSLAGALLKLSGGAAARPVERTSILGRHGAVEGRIRRLLGEEREAKAVRGPRGSTIFVSLILPLFLLISLGMPLKDAMPSKITTCTTSHCSKHKARPDRHCHTHCEKTLPVGKGITMKPLSRLR
ncbi:MAG: M56 family metallopeptidase [Thermodesulfobacteriota bacterium]